MDVRDASPGAAKRGDQRRNSRTERRDAREYIGTSSQAGPGLHGRGAWDLVLLRGWCWCPDSNGGPTDYESVALPTELHQRSGGANYTRPAPARPPGVT